MFKSTTTGKMRVGQPPVKAKMGIPPEIKRRSPAVLRGGAKTKGAGIPPEFRKGMASASDDSVQTN